MPSETLTETLRGFVERNRNRYPIDEEFPFDTLEKLTRRSIGEPEVAVLFALLDLTHRFNDATDRNGRTAYHGYDLRRKAAVILALGGCEGANAAPMAEFVLTLFRPVMQTRGYATPGSPDIDKFDRDSAAESAEDCVALACLRALARLDVWTDETRWAMSDARRHRSEEVRELAKQMMTHLAPLGPLPAPKSLSEFHKFVFEVVRKQRPRWTPVPGSEDRIFDAQQRLGRPLPKDYRAFLSELGQIYWPFSIGSVASYHRNDYPPDFVPFADIKNVRYGFLLVPRRPILEDGEPLEQEGHLRIARFKFGELGFVEDHEEELPNSFEGWLRGKIDSALREIAVAGG